MHNIDFTKIALNQKETRVSKGLTQEYMANIADVNTSHISNIENNRTKVSLPILVQMCNALDTTVDYILGDEYTSPPSALEQEILHELQLCSYETQKQILKIIKAFLSICCAVSINHFLMVVSKISPTSLFRIFSV